jgi:eukaryotic-like serine/threonine-protein kinase
MSFQPGDTIADYQILGILGQGGMGTVYRVRNLLSGREEAMKVVLPGQATDADAADRFLREIKIQASLQHPNIAVLRTAVRADHNILMIMELVEGASVEKILHAGRPALAQAIRIADDILGALGYAHQLGVVHRDVKPANIIVTSRGHPKLMDFGIARAAGDNRLTQSGTAMGSLYYMSPEQVLSHPVDERSDLYSMGATFYEMLTGRRPVEGDSQYAIMNAHLTQFPPAPSDIVADVPRELSSVVIRSLAKTPEARFQTAHEFQAALRQATFGATATKLFSVPHADPGHSPMAHRPAFDETLLARMEARLAASVGPIARTLVAQAAARYRNPGDPAALCRDLAQQIPDERTRLDFLRTFGAISGSQAAHATPSSGTPSAPQPVPLDERTVDAARKALAAYLGPMAALVVKQALRSAHTKDQLKAALAAEIPDERARRAFLDSF